MKRLFSWIRFIFWMICISLLVILGALAYGLGYGYGSTIWDGFYESQEISGE